MFCAQMKRIKLIVLTLTLLSVFGCGGYTVTHTMLTSTDEGLSPNVGSIEVYMKGDTPDRSFKKIARIDVSKTDVRGSFSGGLEAMKKRAGEIGADAIIEVDINVAPDGTVCSGCVTGSAIAVMWQ